MYRKAEVEIHGGGILACCGAPDLAIHVDDLCIVEQDGIPEFGRVLKLQEVDAAPPDGRRANLVRRATLQDQSRADENNVRSRMAAETCARQAEERALKLHFVRVRYSFDRAVLHVLFTAEEPVDTRDLVKTLARELRTRIEMRQIGVRDEAAIVGGVAPCGRKLCCCTWLTRFESINVKMAKVQGLSLNPSSMSGLCGRLKCCLRYEYDLYRELGRCVPRQGCEVNCPAGKGVVIGREVLKQRVMVRVEGDGTNVYEADEVSECWSRKPRGGRSDDEDSRSERPEPGAAGDEGTVDLRADDAE